MTDETPGKARDLYQLVTEYERWTHLQHVEQDKDGAYEQLAALYKYAIAQYETPGIEHVLDALAQAEGTD